MPTQTPHSDSPPQPIPYATPAAYGGPKQSNRAATRSIICSLCFVILLTIGIPVGHMDGDHDFALTLIGALALLASLLAVIFGILALTKTRRGHHDGKAKAIIGTTLGGISFLFMLFVIKEEVFMPSPLGRSSAAANTVKCRANLLQIGLAMQLYANENKGLYPTRPQDLILTQDITTEVFTCPSTNDTKAPGATPQEQAANLSKPGHLSYIYLGSGKNTATPANVVLVYEPLANHGHGMNILFADLHAEFFTGAIAQKIQSELQLGQNPPPSRPGGAQQ